jgi:hypothetical protein
MALASVPPEGKRRGGGPWPVTTVRKGSVHESHGPPSPGARLCRPRPAAASWQAAGLRLACSRRCGDQHSWFAPLPRWRDGFQRGDAKDAEGRRGRARRQSLDTALPYLRSFARREDSGQSAATGPFCYPQVQAVAPPIPTGLGPPAQGCAHRATLGGRSPRETTPTGLCRAGPGSGHNPVGVGTHFPGLPRVARRAQPWAGGRNPVGIQARARGNLRVMERRGRGFFSGQLVAQCGVTSPAAKKRGPVRALPSCSFAAPPLCVPPRSLRSLR